MSGIDRVSTGEPYAARDPPTLVAARSPGARAHFQEACESGQSIAQMLDCLDFF
jgi:hypothetical protein